MWPEQPATEQLLREAQGGDRGAVDRLLDRHRAAVRHLIELRMDRRLGRRVDASDIAQEVLVEAHRRLAAYLNSPPMPFHLWLRQLAEQRVIDAHRRHRRARRRSLDREQPAISSDHSSLDLLGQIADRQLTPEAATIRAELSRRFFEAIEELDGADREILLMRHLEQLSNHETALALGLSDAAAGMRYLRALRRLRAQLPGANDEEQR